MFSCCCGKNFDSEISCARHKATCLIYRKQHKRPEKKDFKQEGIDHVVCLCCGYKAMDLTAHLRYSEPPHLNAREYKEKFSGAAIVCADVEKRRKKTCLERHGNANYRNSEAQSRGIRAAISPELLLKIKNTKRRLYGNPNYVNAESRKKTLLDKYGVDNPMKVESIKKRSIETRKNLYGKIFNEKDTGT